MYPDPPTLRAERFVAAIEAHFLARPGEVTTADVEFLRYAQFAHLTHDDLQRAAALLAQHLVTDYGWMIAEAQVLQRFFSQHLIILDLRF